MSTWNSRYQFARIYPLENEYFFGSKSKKRKKKRGKKKRKLSRINYTGLVLVICTIQCTGTYKLFNSWFILSLNFMHKIGETFQLLRSRDNQLRPLKNFCDTRPKWMWNANINKTWKREKLSKTSKNSCKDWKSIGNETKWRMDKYKTRKWWKGILESFENIV